MEATKRLSTSKAKEHKPPKTSNPLYAQELENPVSKGIKAYLSAIKDRLDEMVSLKCVEAMRTKNIQTVHLGGQGMGKSSASHVVAQYWEDAVFDALYKGSVVDLQRGAPPEPMIEPEYVYLQQQVENIVPLLKIIAASGNSFYLLQAEKLLKNMKENGKLFEVENRSGIRDYGYDMLSRDEWSGVIANQMNYYNGQVHQANAQKTLAGP